MDLAITYSRAVAGINSPLVTIEIHLSRGLPGLTMVGLPETAVRESKERVRSAIINNNFEFPLRRITINLAPADLPKEGARYDLAIALGILAASGQIANKSLNCYEFLGELALTGSLRKVNGVLPAALATKEHRKNLVLPVANAAEASLIENLDIFPVEHLMEICAHLNTVKNIDKYERRKRILPLSNPGCDLKDVQAQHQAKRALEIAAAGGHNMLMTGPPGTGKTMLAERLAGLLPEMTEKQALDTAALYSISRIGFDHSVWMQRPFRRPHHSSSAVALAGGGINPKPGEISLAHNGVLFLDELPEFDRRVLEILREPLESGRILVSRAAYHVEFPCAFQLVAAMNPCPCGYYTDPQQECKCSPEKINRYHARISGPLLDRIDIHIVVPNLSSEILHKNAREQGESSKSVRQRVSLAYEHQLQRVGKQNNRLSVNEIERFCKLNDEQVRLMDRAVTKLSLSVRAMHRILKLSRTIADLANSKEISTQHLSEAISYRSLNYMNSNHI